RTRWPYQRHHLALADQQIQPLQRDDFEIRHLVNLDEVIRLNKDRTLVRRLRRSVRSLTHHPISSLTFEGYSSPRRSTWLTLIRLRKIAATPISAVNAITSASSSPPTASQGTRSVSLPTSAKNGSSRYASPSPSSEPMTSAGAINTTCSTNSNRQMWRASQPSARSTPNVNARWRAVTTR